MATLKAGMFGTAPRNDQGYIADRNLYLDADGNLVEEDDPKQVRQLVGKGGAISTEVAQKHGLLKAKKAKAESAEEAETETAAEAETAEAETTDGEQDSKPEAKPAAKPKAKSAAKKKGAKK